MGAHTLMWRLKLTQALHLVLSHWRQMLIDIKAGDYCSIFVKARELAAEIMQGTGKRRRKRQERQGIVGRTPVSASCRRIREGRTLRRRWDLNGKMPVSAWWQKMRRKRRKKRREIEGKKLVSMLSRRIKYRHLEETKKEEEEKQMLIKGQKRKRRTLVC